MADSCHSLVIPNHSYTVKQFIVAKAAAVALALSTGLSAYSLQAGQQWPPMGSAQPTVEVAPELGPDSDMDDPAIWIHPDSSQRARSFVIATAKTGGMRVYNLQGRLMQSIPARRNSEGKAVERFNNVEVQYGLRLGSAVADIAVATDRVGDRLRVWRIDTTRSEPLVEITDPASPRIFPTRPDPKNHATGTLPNPDNGRRGAYGLALYRDVQAGKYFAMVTQTGEAVVAKWELIATPAGTVTARFVRDWRFPADYKDQTARKLSQQFEGFVVDQQTGIAYGAQEDVGIWRIHLANGEDRAETAPFVETRTFDPKSPIVPDVEGLTIYYGKDGDGYLLASSQGSAHGSKPKPTPPLDDSFVVFERKGSNKYVGSFHIVANTSLGIDGAQQCDGMDVTSISLPGFPGGLLVTQDGFNDDNFASSGASTNLKFTPWKAVVDGFPLPLIASTNYDPRNPM